MNGNRYGTGVYARNPFSAGLGSMVRTYMMAEQLRERERETRQREMYRKSVHDASKRRTDISEEYLDIARQREQRLSEPSPREQIDQMFLNQLQGLPSERVSELAQRRYSGAPRTTLQVDDLQDVIDADFDAWQMGQSGGISETVDVWGEKQQVLSEDFSPDPTQVDQLIEDIGVTYGDITGLPRESLTNLAQRQARNRWRNYQGGAMFRLEPTPSIGQPDVERPTGREQLNRTALDWLGQPIVGPGGLGRPSQEPAGAKEMFAPPKSPIAGHRLETMKYVPGQKPTSSVIPLERPPAPIDSAQTKDYERVMKKWFYMDSDVEYMIYQALDAGLTWKEIATSDEIKGYLRY